MRTIADIQNDIKENEIKLGHQQDAHKMYTQRWLNMRLSSDDEGRKGASRSIAFHNRQIEALKAELAEALGE